MIRDRLVAPDGFELLRANADDRQAVEDLQFAAYAANREMLGVEPVPLLADYDTIMRTHEVWIKPNDRASDTLLAALILDTSDADHLLIWSVSTSPTSQRLGLGHALLQCAKQRARELGRSCIRLYTGATLDHLISWYRRNGFEIERTESLHDRELVHMVKMLKS